MLDTLLESRSKGTQSHGGTIVSVAAHTALIAAALYATAQAHVSPVDQATIVRPVYFPRVLQATPVTRATAANSTPAIERRLLFVQPVTVDLPVAIDVSSIASRSSDFPGVPSAGAGSTASAGVSDSSAAFSADQVEKQVSVAEGASPRYPESLRNAGIEGQVTAIFVVDESGRAEDSVRFLHADNVLFEEAVRVALRRMRFTPAEVGGRKVRQLVQMPFVFTLKK